MTLFHSALQPKDVQSWATESKSIPKEAGWHHWDEKEWPSAGWGSRETSELRPGVLWAKWLLQLQHQEKKYILFYIIWLFVFFKGLDNSFFIFFSEKSSSLTKTIRRDSNEVSISCQTRFIWHGVITQSWPPSFHDCFQPTENGKKVNIWKMKMFEIF